MAEWKRVLNQRLTGGNERMRLPDGLITAYMDTESALLTAGHTNHNISSDIIESDFGFFKDYMP